MKSKLKTILELGSVPGVVRFYSGVLNVPKSIDDGLINMAPSKTNPKKSSCENTHELINMHHTCNMHIPYGKVRKPNNFRQADCNQSITHDSLKNSWITDEEESEIS
jgi:hypothetical protein